MLSLEQWLIFLSVSFAVSASPGPLMLLSLSNGASYGYFRTLPGMLGASLAHIVLVVLTALGIGVIVHASPSLFSATKWIGILYLICMGAGYCFLRRASTVESEDTDREPNNINILMRFFVVSVSNPKALLFFVALFPQFIVGDDALVSQFAILTITFIVTDFIWMSVYAKGGFVLATWLKTAGHGHMVNQICGSLLIIAALMLVFLA